MSAIRFDRHAHMGAETLEAILELIKDVYTLDVDFKFSLQNSLYGLFDGYYYKELLSKHIELLREESPEFTKRLEQILEEVETYPPGETQV